MKVLMLNGSSHINGTTMAALTEVGKALEEDGIEYEIFQIGGGPIADCLGCGQCTENGCIFSDDAVNAFVEKAKAADGYIFGTPVYYAHPSGRIQSFLDRVFYSSGKHFAHKPGVPFGAVQKVPEDELSGLPDRTADQRCQGAAHRPVPFGSRGGFHGGLRGCQLLCPRL